MDDGTIPGHPDDATIACIGCGKTFLFSSGEKRFYEDKNLSVPRRCKPCRDERRVKKQEESNG